MTNRTVVLFAALALGSLALPGDASLRETVIEDDLSVVRRAVQETPKAEADRDEPPAVRKGGKPQWLRVRVTERHGKRVRVNLPLSLVRVVGDWPIDFGCGGGRYDDSPRRCKLKISEVLEALDAGQTLVEVDDDGTKVRIWIE
jgi:hypothetical protein